MPGCPGAGQAHQGSAMIQTAVDLSAQEFKNDPKVKTVTDTNSPRGLDRLHDAS